MKSIATNEVNFNDLVKQHGYVIARQKLQQQTIQLQQKNVTQTEQKINQSKHALRVEDLIKRGATHGKIDSDSMLDKILKLNGSTKMINIEGAVTDNSSQKESKLLNKLIKESLIESNSLGSYMPEKIKHHQLLIKSEGDPLKDYHDHGNEPNNVYREALRTADRTYSYPNAGLTSLPSELGDTLNLQLSYFNKLNCPRNHLKSLLSPDTCQLSLYHLRNLTEIKLNENKIEALPTDLGMLSSLTIIDLSYNKLRTLPTSISQLKKIKQLLLSNNLFSQLSDGVGYLDSLEEIDLSTNNFSTFPAQLIKLRSIKKINLGKNQLAQLAIIPICLKKEDLWKKVIDRRTGKEVYINILTKERVHEIAYYTGHGLQHAHDLHVFQRVNTLSYVRRKMYLSINQIPEWEPTVDQYSGLVYYRNNVSGDTSWSMPKSLDLIGDMNTLEEIHLFGNVIKEFPNSFTKLLQLRKINIFKNRIHSLLDDIGSLKYLVLLDISSNQLKILPTSICQCIALERLVLKDNNLLRLPEELGRLPNLKSLDIAMNRLRSIPFTLGYTKTLEYLDATENPLVDPPYEEFSKPLLELQWYLRNRFIIEQQGKPPAMKYHKIGLQREITILKSEFNKMIDQMITVSYKDGSLNLQLLGIQNIPKQILKLKGLKKLRLDFNDELQLIDGFPKELKGLTFLSLKCCHIQFLPNNIYHLDKLTTLILEGNYLETLPQEIIYLKHLIHFDLSKNRLYDLPDDITNHFTQLHTLNLEGNHIEIFPKNIENLSQLKQLNLSKNGMRDIPKSIHLLKNLKILNLEKNQLQNLPISISTMELIELRIGYNHIEKLSEEFFSYQLGQSIKRFSCCENNMLELPTSLYKIHIESTLEADYNPFISPPPPLLSEGLQTIQNYLIIRKHRKLTLCQLMEDEDFEFNPLAISPIAYEVLEDGTGFLTPDDLGEFDQALHEYLNGEYYKCPSSGEEILSALITLRDKRETDMYLLVLNTFLSVIKMIIERKDKRFNKSCLMEGIRPWGKDSENCGVWILSLEALLKTIGKDHVLHPNGRPSVFEMVAKKMPVTPFPFTVDLLKDSARLYLSPYGQIAETEMCTFPICECVDPIRNKARRHNPCTKAAVVIVKSVYTEEEAHRREIEEDSFIIQFEQIEDDIELWIASEEGKKLLEKEYRRRKQVYREEIRIREELRLSVQLKVRKCKENLVKLEYRKIQYQSGEPFGIHGFHDIIEADTEIGTTEKEINRLSGRMNTLQLIINDLNDQLNMEKNDALEICKKDLIQKYCVISYRESVTANRMHAAKYNLSRYWDGSDGQDFEDWKKHHKYLVPVEGSVITDAMQINDPVVKPKKIIDEDGPEFNFDHLHDMSKYKLLLYETYRIKHSPYQLFG